MTNFHEVLNRPSPDPLPRCRVRTRTVEFCTVAIRLPPGLNAIVALCWLPLPEPVVVNDKTTFCTT